MARFLVIGAGGGIGQGVVKQLKHEGHECITTARTTQKNST